MSKKTDVDPIPEEFDSHEEVAEFWDTHDTTDYPDAFRNAKVESEFRGRRYEVELEEEVIKKLQAQARQKGYRLSGRYLAPHCSIRSGEYKSRQLVLSAKLS